MTKTATARRIENSGFDTHLLACGLGALERSQPTTLQVNVGKLCNQTCHHCHVEAGPGRKEIMTRGTADRVLELLARSPAIELVDITGGAPEMNSNFRRLVGRARELERNVSVRSNLTILLQPGFEDMIEFFAAKEVTVIASLPCYTAENVDAQRGKGAFAASIEALFRLNEAGFGREGSGLTLHLVYNPLGAFLPPSQAELQAAYKKQLKDHFGIVFNELYTITNMPIKRFSEMLRREGKVESYMALLVESFNPEAARGVMCRDLVSVGYDGDLFDCDFNQMLELPLGLPRTKSPRSIWDIETLDDLSGKGIRTGSHCFGCTAGEGSSCSGALT